MARRHATVLSSSSPPLPSSSAAPRRRPEYDYARKGLLRIPYPAVAFRRLLDVLADSNATVHGPQPNEIRRRCWPPLRGLSEVGADGEETERFTLSSPPSYWAASSAAQEYAYVCWGPLRIPCPMARGRVSPALAAPCTAPAPTYSGPPVMARTPRFVSFPRLLTAMDTEHK